MLDFSFLVFLGGAHDVEHVVEGLDTVLLGDYDRIFREEHCGVDVHFHEGGSEVILADAENGDDLWVHDGVLGDGGGMVHDGDLILVVHEEEARFFISLEEAMEVLGVLDLILDDEGIAMALNERFTPRARVEGDDPAPVCGDT